MKKITLCLLIFVLAISQLAFAESDDIDKQEEILEEMEDRLNNLEASHSDFVNQKNAVIRNIRSLEESVKATETEIVVLDGKIEENQVQVGIATLELEAAKQALQDTNDLLDDRIRVMYMNGSIGYFEVILESKNFEDLLTRIEMLQRIINSDTELIAKMEVDKQNVDDKKSNLETEQLTLIDLQGEMQVKQEELKDQISEFEAQKLQLIADMDAVAIQIDDTNKDAEEVKAIIKDLELRAQYVGGIMSWPVPSKKTISSPFGMRIHPILGVNKLHTGIDIPAPEGSAAIAAQNGTVIWSNWLSSYGKCVMIDHGGGIVTLYAHNSRLLVNKGDNVTKGQNVALTGNTGNSTGPHLHFEVRVNGEYVNPMEKWLTASSEF